MVEVERRTRGFYGWWLLLFLWIIYTIPIGFAFYGPAVLYPVMIRNLGWSRGEIMTGSTAILLLLGLGAPLAAWMVGRFAPLHASPSRRRLAGAAALVAIAAGLGLPLRAVTAESERLDWKPFSAELVAELEGAGRPYFLDFTASWCLSCQVNEQVALDTPAVRAAFERQGITAVQADWTNRDDRIARALAEHGRASVPVYVLHPGSEDGERLLPNILTESLVLDAVEAAMRQAP